MKKLVVVTTILGLSIGIGLGTGIVLAHNDTILAGHDHTDHIWLGEGFDQIMFNGGSASINFGTLYPTVPAWDADIYYHENTPGFTEKSLDVCSLEKVSISSRNGGLEPIPYASVEVVKNGDVIITIGGASQ